MSTNRPEARILYLPDGITFTSGPDMWTVPHLKLMRRSWTALIPAGIEPVVDPAVNLSRVLATMLEPTRGTVELLNQNVYRLEYGIRQRMRARLGFVHGYGGLLSNRTIRENIELPVSVHGKLSATEEAKEVSHIVRTFGLSKVEQLKPHEVDGATRWNVCLARALVLRPQWLVLEGIGNWEMDRGQSTSWKALMDRRHTSDMAVAICLPRRNPGFETWFEKLGGSLVQYHLSETPPDQRRTA